ncbi:hypothetical protein L9F63_026510 [Diploptera punctata]|uniref:Protein SEC13 homolog n=1 Tax=Diploptera punctata TaxID=6984 RepID=A0AAD8AJ62_DIPPU|nr:hypothetical protein L9F63_026510 [Diploptera punctata]
MVSVLNTVDTGHEDMIHDAEMDYYGLRLATCSSDNSVKIYDIKNGTQTLTADLKGHYGPVWQVAWAHPKYGNLLSSCSYDRRVIIWKEMGEWVKLHEIHSDGSLSILSNNLDTGNWEAKKIPNAHTIGCNAVSWCPATSPNPAFDASSVGRSPVLVKRLIWKEEGDRWVEEAKLDVHSDWVRDVAWAPSIGLPRSIIASCSQDRRVIIWASDDNVYLGNKGDAHILIDGVWNVSWSLTGNILAVSGGDNKVSLWRENNEGQWTCISEVSKGQGQMAGSEQRAL